MIQQNFFPKRFKTPAVQQRARELSPKGGLIQEIARPADAQVSLRFDDIMKRAGTMVQGAQFGSFAGGLGQLAGTKLATSILDFGKTGYTPPTFQELGKKISDNIFSGAKTLATNLIPNQDKIVKPMEKKEPLQKVVAPTATPTPTITPTPAQKRIEAYPAGPSTPPRSELFPKLQAEEYQIQPQVWDAIDSIITDDYKKRLAMTLAYQESTGGLTPVGDKGQSFGPYHIMPGNEPRVAGFNVVNGKYTPITREQAEDPVYSTKFVNAFMDQMKKKGYKDEAVLREWNYWSGYRPSWYDEKGNPQYGPKYDVDIPRGATMSAKVRS